MRTRTRRSYEARDVARALAILRSHGGNVMRTARELGIPRSTIIEWRDLHEADPLTHGDLDVAPDLLSGGADTGDASGAQDSASASSPAQRAVEVQAVRREEEERVASRLELTRERYIDHLLEPETVKKAGARDSAIVVSITSERLAMLRGEPTQRTEHVVVRYVEPGALRELARTAKAKVIDVTARVREAAASS